VAVESSIEVNFRLLLDARTWYTRRANFATLEGDTRPVLLRAAYPSPGGNGTADVAVGFDLDERGLPINIHVDSSSAPDFENEITNVIREWRFQPAMRNGAPVPVHGSVEFARGGTAVTLPAPDRKQ
jgi:TonB family protein